MNILVEKETIVFQSLDDKVQIKLSLGGESSGNLSNILDFKQGLLENLSLDILDTSGADLHRIPDIQSGSGYRWELSTSAGGFGYTMVIKDWNTINCVLEVIETITQRRIDEDFYA